MPLVQVKYRQEAAKHMSLELGMTLCHGVAFALTCDDDDGQLAPGDVEVHFSEMSFFDICEFDVVIDVEAKHFPSRHINFDERATELEGIISRTLPKGLSFGLWVKLNNAAWRQSEGTSREWTGDVPPPSSFPGHHKAHGLG